MNIIESLPPLKNGVSISRRNTEIDKEKKFHKHDDKLLDKLLDLVKRLKCEFVSPREWIETVLRQKKLV